MFLKILYLFLGLSFYGLGILPAQDYEEIVVELGTDSQRIPLYLAKFTDAHHLFSTEYLTQLEGVLRFDLNYNGMTSLLPYSATHEQWANKCTVEGGMDSKAKGAHPLYLLKVGVDKDKKLSALLYIATSDALKSLSGLSLSGELSQDRRQIHHLADAVYKSLFDREGIASTRILYTVKKTGVQKEWRSEVWEADYDGENSRIVLKDSGYQLSPLYMPPKQGCQSSSFLYVAYQTAQPKIFVSSLRAAQKGQRLLSLRGNQLTPAISRQRDQIAFISDVTGNPDLFLQPFSPEKGAIGKPRQIFSSRQSSQGSPTFSPDGKKLAFVSNKDGSPRIYLMTIPPPNTPLKNVKVELLTRHSRESSAPAWSPDGSKIAYCAKVGAVRQIWVYDFQTKEEIQLTSSAINKENPTWSPNSLCLTYNSSDAGACELYILTVNEPQTAKISVGSGEKRFPNWEPR
jgi:TolB protein